MRCLPALAIFMVLACMPINARAQDSPLKPEILNKILQWMVTNGGDVESPAVLTSALGFTDVGQKWSSREVDAHDDRPGFLHGFAISRGDEQDIALILRGPDSIHVFRVHRNGVLVRAVVYDFKTRQITMDSPDEGQKGLDVELKFWENVRPPKSN